MSPSEQVRDGIRAVGIAWRRPEAFAIRWRDQGNDSAPQRLVFPLLGLNAMFGFASYGLAVGMRGGASTMLEQAGLCVICGLSWFVALPALYIINSLLGSRLDLSTTLLAVLVTISFGTLAMLAGVPVSWFFQLAIPRDFTWLQRVVQSALFAGVAFSMVDVFLRVMSALEPERESPYGFIWLCLVGTLGYELMHLLGAGPFSFA